MKTIITLLIYLFFAAIGIVISILVFFKYMMAGAYEGVAILAIFYLVALGVILLQAQEGKGRASSYILALPPVATIVFVILITTFADITRCGCFGLFGYASWKEEVLLHDGSKIIVKRWQKRSGPHSLGESPGIGEYSISFKHPGTKKTITWKDGPTEDIQYNNFDPVALHIKNNTPYLITTTYGCLSYNKWGRPNPPYVIFKFEGDEWKRIPLSDLPPEFKNVNLVINTTGYDEEIAIGQGTVSVEKVSELNSSLTQEIYKTIVRTPFRQEGPESCPVMIYAANKGWFSEGFFTIQHSYEACLELCSFYKMGAETCPCKRLFNNNTKGE